MPLAAGDFLKTGNRMHAGRYCACIRLFLKGANLNHTVITKFHVGCPDEAAVALSKHYFNLVRDLAAGGLHVGRSEWDPAANCILRFSTPWLGSYTVGEDRALNPDLEEQIRQRFKPMQGIVTLTMVETIAEHENPPPELIAL